MKKILCIFCIALSLFFLHGCVVNLSSGGAKEVFGRTDIRYAQDYLGMTKAEITKLLGEKEEQEYYNGAMLYRFQKSDIWFWFGEGESSFRLIPDDATCVYVLTTVNGAAAFDAKTVSLDTLSDILGMTFSESVLDEHDGVFSAYATEGNIQCIVSCTEEGDVSVEKDTITFQII